MINSVTISTEKRYDINRDREAKKLLLDKELIK
jgi:hypothetical protein